LPLHLVTGGAGYFGEVLVRHLVDSGARTRVFDLNVLAGVPGVESIQGDIRDRAAVRRSCEGVSYIHHNVAQVPLAKDKRQFWSVNRDGTRNILEAAREVGVRKVVYTSSSAVFGVPRSNPVTEATTPTPAEEYGQAKYEAELLCAEFSARGLDVSIVRPRTILGHGRLGIFQILFEWVFNGYNIPVLGSGDNLYQFVHADDLALACLSAASRPGPATYNIGAKSFGSMRSTLQALCDHARTGSRVKSVPMGLIEPLMRITGALGLTPLGPYHALMYGRSLYFDTSKAETELGYTPKYTQDEMMAESYDWYVAQREDILSGRRPGSKHQSAVRQGLLRLVPLVL
jgi:nucleoside-diphosphate-sugar epimerase